MEITPKSNLEPFSLPLLIYNTVVIGEATSKEGKQFSIFIGLDKNMATQLKALSLDESDVELQKNTSDLKRFGEGSYEDWYKKNRTPFALFDNATNTLAAIIWFGSKPLGRKSLKHLSSEQLAEDETKLNSENWHTISYRSYPGFRGKGLMKDFGSFAIGVYIRKFPNIKLWTSTNEENTAGTAYASALGFKLNEEASDRKNNWLVMIK